MTGQQIAVFNAPLAVLAGALVVTGSIALGAGLCRRWLPVNRSPRVRTPLGHRSKSAWASLTRRPPGPAGRRRDLLLAGSLVLGFLIAVWSGWFLAVVLVPLLAVGLPYLLVIPQARDVLVLEALDRWVRSLVATLSTGRSVIESIRLSRRTAPAVIATEVGSLVARLDSRWSTRQALQRFADDLDSPDADPIVAALMLAADRGAVGASVTLNELAESIQEQLKGRRLIETERARPYTVVRQVTVITLVTLIAVFVLSPGFFAAYRSPIGQVVLAVLLVCYLGSLILLRRRARQLPRARILVSLPSNSNRVAAQPSRGPS